MSKKFSVKKYQNDRSKSKTFKDWNLEVSRDRRLGHMQNDGVLHDRSASEQYDAEWKELKEELAKLIRSE